MWSYEAADEADHLLLECHATLDPTKARMEAVPACSVAPDPAHLWNRRIVGRVASYWQFRLRLYA